jgi:hypothetical protein
MEFSEGTPEFDRDVRQVVGGGAIGLARIASFIGSSHKINDLRPVEVGPLERPQAAVEADKPSARLLALQFSVRISLASRNFSR